MTAIDQALEHLLIGNSPAIARVRSIIKRVAPASVPVLIEGPTGAGKELVARALHIASGRTGEFVAFNACAIPDTMFEDALFGHVRGAFTGAAADRRGYLAEANGGTLFLDEVSSLPLSPQAKLLRAIETKEFRPVGSMSSRRSDFRTVSATNESLAHVSGQGRFRMDLLYRLRGIVITVPPLVARLNDVPLLANYFAAASVTNCGAPATIAEDAMDLLLSHSWPGNVRELRSIIECAVSLLDGGIITRAYLERSGALHTGEVTSASRGRGDAVKQRLLEVLEQTSWDVTATAEILGVHRATIYRRLERAGHGPPRSRAV